jgi:hypothetical protein
MMSQKASPKIVYFITPNEWFLCKGMNVLLHKENKVFLRKLFSLLLGIQQKLCMMGKDTSGIIAFYASLLQ